MKHIIKLIFLSICCIILFGCNEEEVKKNTNYYLELDKNYSSYEWTYEITNSNILSVSENGNNEYTIIGLSNGSSSIRFTYSNLNSEEKHGFYYVFSVDKNLNVKIESEEKW